MRLVYRADTRPPNEIFTVGFKPRFGGGIQIQKGGQMIGGISTSKDITVAMNYAALYEGYVYAMFADDKSIDVVDALIKAGNRSALKNAYTQMEIACKIVKPEHIFLARKVTLDLRHDMIWQGVMSTNSKATVNHGPEYSTALSLFNMKQSFQPPDKR
ncbi:hypothetical protein ACODM8_04395 [Vibrio ostreicida]|uniref:DUF1845 domain-containing protein n=1 Tax=Vibrio ostreicida TaxID=526588 RepID=A0ABT8BWG0_9VIBR|nr:hypothetical protein [Vibrio ostreicida]MDN3610418.1 hypothetical protein [Vibrio ostreicida]NPD07573.1 hypothetical protein [Vibrio ostreicida]